VWATGENSNDLWISTAGNYTVGMSIGGCLFEDDIIVQPSANTGVDLGSDAIICDGQVMNLSSGYEADETSWWENGVSVGNASTWNVTNMDAIIVAEVTVGFCVERDTVSFDYAPVFDAGLPANLALCNGDSTLVTANAGAESYTWSSGQLASSLWINSPGTYSLSIPVQGCEYTTDVSVQNVPLPIFDLGADQTICEGQSIQFSTGLPNADITDWSNGADTATIIVGAAGIFEVEVTENGCSFADAVTLSIQDLPIFDLGEDQMLCSDEFAALYIYPLPEEADVTWSTGNVQPSIEVNAPGVYSALVNWNGCTWTDEVLVDRAAPVLIDIVEPLSFCEGSELVVSAENPSNLFPISYDWSNGETTPAVVIDRQGFYTVVVANACDTVSKSFEVKLDYCECPVYVPNAFTPDNDGVNDLFLPILGCTTQAYRLEIYNPWGTLVFATEDPEKGWYGQVYGQLNDDLESSEMSGYYAQNTVYNWRLVYRLEADETSLISPAPIELRGHVHFVH
jgi:gliding motility-associated-like protein